MSTKLDVNVESFEKDGFAVIKGAIDPSLMADLRKEWDAFEVTSTESTIPKDQPAAVFWRHIQGERKRIRPIEEFPTLREIAHSPQLSGVIRTVIEARGIKDPELRLLETIVFNKPPQKGGNLNWHQDNAYFPFEPNTQCALWIPLDPVDEENGSLIYVKGTHKRGRVGSLNLHTGEPFEGDSRPMIPKDPVAEGYEVETMELEPGDISVHDGATWHSSTANDSDRPRRALSLRYLVGKTVYAPTPGSAATFIEQVDVKPGDVIQGPAFPVV